MIELLSLPKPKSNILLLKPTSKDVKYSGSVGLSITAVYLYLRQNKNSEMIGY